MEPRLTTKDRTGCPLVAVVVLAAVEEQPKVDCQWRAASPGVSEMRGKDAGAEMPQGPGLC